MFAQVSGAFRKTRPQVRVLGSWRQVRNVFTLVGGAWRPVWSYSWVADGWGSCSVTCGGGTQTQRVWCRRSDGTEMSDSFCSNAGSKPATSQSCNTHPCYTYSWSWSAWSSCNVSCGWGEKTRRVWCERNDGAQVGDSNCSRAGSKPSTWIDCNAGTCVTYSWYAGTFPTTCPAQCGKANKTRTVYCKGSDGASYPDSKCSGKKPATTESCMICYNCTFNESRYLTNKLKELRAVGSYASDYKNCGLSTGNPSGWSTSMLKTYTEKCRGISITNHFNQFGRAEGVCPYTSTDCCISLGFKYY